MAEGYEVRPQVKLFRGTEHCLAWGSVEHADHDCAICLEHLPFFAKLELAREVLKLSSGHDVRRAFLGPPVVFEHFVPRCARGLLFGVTLVETASGVADEVYLM